MVIANHGGQVLEASGDYTGLKTAQVHLHRIFRAASRGFNPRTWNTRCQVRPQPQDASFRPAVRKIKQMENAIKPVISESLGPHQTPWPIISLKDNCGIAQDRRRRQTSNATAKNKNVRCPYHWNRAVQTETPNFQFRRCQPMSSKAIYHRLRGLPSSAIRILLSRSREADNFAVLLSLFLATRPSKVHRFPRTAPGQPASLIPPPLPTVYAKMDPPPRSPSTAPNHVPRSPLPSQVFFFIFTFPFSIFLLPSICKICPICEPSFIPLRRLRAFVLKNAFQNPPQRTQRAQRQLRKPCQTRMSALCPPWLDWNLNSLLKSYCCLTSPHPNIKCSHNVR